MPSLTETVSSTNLAGYKRLDRVLAKSFLPHYVKTAEFSRAGIRSESDREPVCTRPSGQTSAGPRRRRGSRLARGHHPCGAARSSSSSSLAEPPALPQSLAPETGTSRRRAAGRDLSESDTGLH